MLAFEIQRGIKQRWKSDESYYPWWLRPLRSLSLGGEDPLENGMATHSSSLAWRIPLTGDSPCGQKESDKTEREPGGLQSMGYKRVGHH